MASVFKREKSLNVVQANHKKIQFFADYMNDKGGMRECVFPYSQ